MEVWCCEGEGLGRGVGYIASRTGKVSAMLISPGAKVACLTEMGPPCPLTEKNSGHRASSSSCGSITLP